MAIIACTKYAARNFTDSVGGKFTVIFDTTNPKLAKLVETDFNQITELSCHLVATYTKGWLDYTGSPIPENYSVLPGGLATELNFNDNVVIELLTVNGQGTILNEEDVDFSDGPVVFYKDEVNEPA